MAPHTAHACGIPALHRAVSRKQDAWSRLVPQNEVATQDDVFQDLRPFVDATLSGVNAAIITYGQTGSGKTHTLIGTENAEGRGVLPRAVQVLWRGIAVSDQPCTFEVSLSAAEIYCERIRDLLDLSKDNLAVAVDRARGIVLPGAAQLRAAGHAQLLAGIRTALANRVVGATAMNSGSSRSHCVLHLHVTRTFEDGQQRFSKLCLVDLAGSERQDKTAAEGLTAEEGKQINKSLSALGNVISALTAGKAAHVPYRDSKLTRVLQDALGGASRTALIVCCSPAADSAAETLSSLRFAARAAGVVNVALQQTTVAGAASTTATELAALRKECMELRAQLHQLEVSTSTAPLWRSKRLAFVLCQVAMMMALFIAEDLFFAAHCSL